MKTGVTKETEDNKISTIIVYLAAILYIVLGIAFLVIPNLEAEQFCYLLAGGLILLGILRIGEYFIKESYRNVNQYGFSIGVFTIILGICIIIRIEQFADIFNLCLGVGILLTAIVKVQNAMDLRALEDRGFFLFLGLSVIMVICAALILVNPFSKTDVRNQFTYLVLIGDGILSIVSTTYLIIRSGSSKSRPEKEAAFETLEDDGNEQQEQEPL